MSFLCDLCIAGVRFQIRAPFDLCLPDSFRPFLAAEEYPAAPEVFVRVEAGGLPERQGDFVIRSFSWAPGKSIYRLERKDAPGQILVRIPPDFQSAFARKANWLLYLAAERPLLHHGRVLLHASAVLHEGKAYVFTAPSGGGKSTQARVWEQSLHAQIMNGDKVILHDTGTTLMAYGSPIAGSSGIYRSISAPVAAIVQLKKAPCNSLSLLSRRESFLLLYSEAVKSEWDVAFNQRLLELLADYPERAPYVRLGCVPNATAAEALLHYLNQMEKGNNPT